LAANLSLLRKVEWHGSKGLLRNSAGSAEHSSWCEGIVREAIGILFTVLSNINIDSVNVVAKVIVVVIVVISSGENCNSVMLNWESISTRSSPRASNSVILDVSSHNAYRCAWAGTSCHCEVSRGKTHTANVLGYNAHSVGSARSQVSVVIRIGDEASRCRRLNYTKLIGVSCGNRVSRLKRAVVEACIPSNTQGVESPQ